MDEGRLFCSWRRNGGWGYGTTDEILGRAGLKDMAKGVRSVFVAFCSCVSVACRGNTKHSI